jgi:hypothetical protein
MGDFSRFPETHGRASGRYPTRLDDGTMVSLEVWNRQRPVKGHELVRASMMLRMGRSADQTVSVTDISLFVGRAGRMDIEITPSGYYRFGRHMNRSLRELSKELAFKVAPQNVEDPEADAPGFTR